MRKVIFVTGLSGVGKSYYIKGAHPEATVIDYEVLRQQAMDWYPEMDQYEVPTYVKLAAANELRECMELGRETIAVECTGMSKVQQAAIAALVDCASGYGYQAEIVYLKPADWHQFYHSIAGDGQALGMYRDFMQGHPRWREPDRCPYFQNVTVLEVQRDDLEDYHEDLETRLAAERGVL